MQRCGQDGRFVEGDGARLAYATAGTDGSPVLLVMGYLAPGVTWALQVPALAPHHRVAWYDHRGVGATEAPVEPWTTARFAGDAVRLLDHLGWESAHVVGVSMGGMVAQELALSHRARVRSLTLVTTHPGGHLARTPPLRGAVRFLRANTGPRRRRLRHLQRLLYPDDWLQSTDRAELARALQEAFGHPPAKGAHLGHLNVVWSHSAVRRLRALAGLPTLVVKAGRDVLVRPAESDRLARLIPGARLVTFERSGHGVLRQHADEVNELLVAHLAEADAAAGEVAMT